MRLILIDCLSVDYGLEIELFEYTMFMTTTQTPK